MLHLVYEYEGSVDGWVLEADGSNTRDNIVGYFLKYVWRGPR